MRLGMEKKIGVIITSYADYMAKEDLLKQLVYKIKKLDKYLVVVSSHLPVSTSIQEYADIVLYDKNNVVDERKYSHGVAECMLIDQGISALKYYEVETFHKLTYDCELNDVSIFEEWERNSYGRKFVGASWGGSCGNPGNGIDGCCFYTDLNWFKSHFPLYKSIDTMFQVSNMLEVCWGVSLSQQDRNQCYLYPGSLEMFHDSRYNNGKNRLNIVNNT
jgi:hypothetical protein